MIEAGCDTSAVGHDKYVNGDDDEQDVAIEELNCIGEKYGNRNPLKLEIDAHLRSIGRFVDTTWSKTRHSRVLEQPRRRRTGAPQ